ncbi:MAG: hypothetical protein NZ959_02030 [Armatimonadetes bacterium]|nr:hypothetical protein [Armatimonadota bacterium]MDW8120839.1 hypothetical protein [Armatimonadota bacterium]
MRKHQILVLMILGSIILFGCRRSSVERLTDGVDKLDMQPTVSPNGKQIVFCRFKKLMIRDEEGTEKELVVNDLSNFASPTFSPDGKRLAFSANHAKAYHSGPSGIHIIVLDIDSGKWDCITPDAHFNTAPSWSPDGTKIAYTRAVRNGNMICVHDVKTKKTQELVFGSGRSAAWSPDGKTIAYVAGKPSRDIYLINADGSNKRRLVGNDQTDDEEPTWTPDGQFVIFTRQTRITDAPESRDLWAVRVADKKEFQLTKCTPGFWAMSPCVTPDGKSVVFALRRLDHAVLRKVTVNWDNPTPVEVR